MAVPELVTNPMSLGKVAVTSGSPVSILANFPSYAGLKCNKISIQALPGNTDTVIVGTSSSMVYTTYVGAIRVLAKGETMEIQHNVGMDKIDVGTFYIDGANTGDGVIAYVHQA